MEQRALKNVNNWWNTNISCYLETSCGQNFNLYLNAAYFFNASVNEKSVVAKETCLPAMVSNTCCSIILSVFYVENLEKVGVESRTFGNWLGTTSVCTTAAATRVTKCQWPRARHFVHIFSLTFLNPIYVKIWWFSIKILVETCV